MEKQIITIDFNQSPTCFIKEFLTISQKAWAFEFKNIIRISANQYDIPYDVNIVSNYLWKNIVLK